MLSIIEKKQVYKGVLDTMKNVEKHDITRNTISLKELLGLSQKRYLLMQDILKPLKMELSKDVEIRNMYFGLDSQNGIGIYVVYEENGKEEFFVISQFDIGDDIEVSYESGLCNHNNLVKDSKDKIIRALNNGFKKSLEKHIDIPSTSQHFLVGSNSNTLEITNKSKNKYFDMEFTYSYLNNKLNVTRNLDCYFPNIVRCLENNETNLKNFVQNVRVYEEDVKYLIKK